MASSVNTNNEKHVTDIEMYFNYFTFTLGTG